MSEWSLSVQEAAAAMDGRLELIGGGGLQDLVFRGVGTDTRVDLQGLLFFALVATSLRGISNNVAATRSPATVAYFLPIYSFLHIFASFLQKV